MPTERVGQVEVGRFKHWAQVTWLLLGLAAESPWSALEGPFLSSFAQMAVTFASLLDSGCGLSHECRQDGCNGTCVNFKALKPT